MIAAFLHGEMFASQGDEPDQTAWDMADRLIDLLHNEWANELDAEELDNAAEWNIAGMD